MKTKNRLQNFTASVLLALMTLIAATFVQSAHAGTMGSNDFMISTGPTSNDAIRGVLLTPLSAAGMPGDEIQLVTAALYYGDRMKENVTSCFSCPTPDNLSEGTVSYEVVKGPATMNWSKVMIDEDAKIGDEIILQASYHDEVSNTTGTSMLTLMSVGNTPAAALKPAAPVLENTAEEESETTEEEVAEEVAEEPTVEEAVMEKEMIDEAPADETAMEKDEPEAMEAEDAMEKDDKMVAAPVSSSTGGNNVLYTVIALLVLLALAAMAAKRRIRKTDALPPEHREKENEIYEAFGDKHIPTEGEEGYTPQNHEEKQKEVEAAFMQIPAEEE